MSQDIIKKIQVQDSGEVFRIGADAQDIDYEDTNIASAIENLSNEIAINTTNIERLVNYFNEINLLATSNADENTVQNENINSLQELYNNLSIELSKITVPSLVNRIIWDNANQRTLRAILGNLENMPYDSVRLWLEALTSNLKKFNSLTWCSITEEQQEEPITLPEEDMLPEDILPEEEPITFPD